MVVTVRVYDVRPPTYSLISRGTSSDASPEEMPKCVYIAAKSRLNKWADMFRRGPPCGLPS